MTSAGTHQLAPKVRYILQDVEKKYWFSVSVFFVDKLFSENKIRFYEPCTRIYNMAKHFVMNVKRFHAQHTDQNIANIDGS